MEPVDVTEAARIQAKADAKSSRVADLVAKKVAAVDCEDFEEAARLKEELNAARAEALAAWQAEQAEVLDQVEKSKTALDVAEESLSVAKQALSVEEVALKEVNALLKQNMAAIKAAVKEEDFTKAAELKDVAGVDLGGRLAAAKEAVAAKKETLAAAKEARAKALTELTDTMLKLDDGKMPKAAKPASRRRPSVAWLKPGGKDAAAGDAEPSEGAAAGDADAPPSKASGLRRPSMAWLKPGGKDVAAGDAEPAEGASAGDADAPPSKASGLRRPSVEAVDFSCCKPGAKAVAPGDAAAVEEGAKDEGGTVEAVSFWRCSGSLRSSSRSEGAPEGKVRKVRDPATAILSAVTVRKLGVAELDPIFLAAGRIANHAVVLNNTMVSLVEGLKESVATCFGAYQCRPVLTQAGPAFAVTTLSDSDGTASIVAQCTSHRGLVVCDEALYGDETKLNADAKAALEVASEALTALTAAVAEANAGGCGISYHMLNGSLGLRLPPAVEEAPAKEQKQKKPKKKGLMSKSMSLGLGAMSKGAGLAAAKAKKLAAKSGGEEGEDVDGAEGECIDEAGTVEDEAAEEAEAAEEIAEEVEEAIEAVEAVGEIEEDEVDDDGLGGFAPDEPDAEAASAAAAAFSAASAVAAGLSKREQFEKAKADSALQKAAFRACTVYCQALFRLRLALVSARFEGVLQGGLRAAVDEVRARVTEVFSAAGRPINWLKVISLDLLKLLEGKLVFKLNLSFDHLQMDAALKKCLNFLTQKMVGMIETIAVKCYLLFKESISMVKKLTCLVTKYVRNPSELRLLAKGLGARDVCRLPGLIKGNAAAFAKVPKILKTLFGTIKWTCLDIKGGLTATPKLLKGPSDVDAEEVEVEVEE